MGNQAADYDYRERESWIETEQEYLLTIFIANTAINFKTPFAKHHMGSSKLKINFEGGNL